MAPASSRSGRTAGSASRSRQAAERRIAGGGAAPLHAEAATSDLTDWPQIAALYGLLLRRHPTPVVELNRAVAIGMAAGPAAGLAIVDDLEARGVLRNYHLLAAARAELLVRHGDVRAAALCYRRAIAECGNRAERAYLQRRLAEVANAVNEAD